MGIKKIGKFFIELKQQNNDLGESALIIDNGYVWIGHLCQAIERYYEYFPEADISVLTSEDRKAILEKEFAKLKFILLSKRLHPRKYSIALQMLLMRQKMYDYVTLFSLDITSLIVGLLFFGKNIVLYNQWGQWWSLEFRKTSQIFKAAYIKKKTAPGLKGFIKGMGLFFVSIQRKDEALFKRSILVVDNGYASQDHIRHSLIRIKKSFPASRVSLLSSRQISWLRSDFPEVEIVEHKSACNYIVILSLDILYIIKALFFRKEKVMLFNRWEQWWSIRIKLLSDYLTVIPYLFFNMIIFIYLLISVSWIFFKRFFNAIRMSFSKNSI